MEERFTPVQRLIRMIEKAWLPKPFLHPVEMATCHALVTNPKLQVHLPITHVPMDQLQMTQWIHDRDTVNKYAQTGNTNGGLTILRNGQYHLYDGHHRARAGMQLGQETFGTKVIEMPNRSMSLDTLSKKIGVTPQQITQSMDLADRRQYENL